MTQNERILEYLNKHGSITPIDAMIDLGVMRLASRISDLKNMGYRIESKMITVKNRFGEECKVAEYKLFSDC